MDPDPLGYVFYFSGSAIYCGEGSTCKINNILHDPASEAVVGAVEVVQQSRPQVVPALHRFKNLFDIDGQGLNLFQVDHGAASTRSTAEVGGCRAPRLLLGKEHLDEVGLGLHLVTEQGQELNLLTLRRGGLRQ